MKVLALTRKELACFFYSPIAYVVATMVLVLTGFAFWFGIARPMSMNQVPPAAFDGTLYFLTFILLFIVPIVTMRSLSEERRSGSIELLLTAPLRDWEVVVGKFLGAYIFFLCIILPTLGYVAFLTAYADPDLGQIATSYVGVVLLGAFFVAVGILSSALTRNQVVAAIFAFVFLMMLWFVGDLGAFMPFVLRGPVSYLSPTSHMSPFFRGEIDTRDVIYHLSGTFLFLFLATRVVEANKWK